MPTSDPPPAVRPHVILVGTDFSEASKMPILQGWQLATQRVDAELHICHVVDPPRGTPKTKAAMIQHEERQLDQLPSTLRNHAIRLAQAYQLAPLNRSLGVHVRIGKPAEQLLQLAVDLDAAMLVVGSHGHSGWERLVIGSVSEQLVRAGRLPVLVSRPKNFEGMVASEQLDPPCPDCINTRFETEGTQWWCDLHARPHVSTHVHSSTGRVDFGRAPMDGGSSAHR